MKVYDSHPMQLNKNNLAAFEFDVAELARQTWKQFFQGSSILICLFDHTHTPKSGLVLA